MTVSWNRPAVAEVVRFVGFWISGGDDCTLNGLNVRWEGGINNDAMFSHRSN